MRDLVLERASLAARHDFDTLPRSAEVDVHPCRRPELSVLAEMANRLVPGIRIGEAELERYYAFDPESILTFNHRGRLLGAVAFLYLTDRGHDALLLDEMSLTHPDLGLLAGRDEEVSAIYVWAIAGQGRSMAGLGNVSEHLCKPRLVIADLFAHPATAAGRDLMVALGFKQIPSFQPDLWCYERPWNRSSPMSPASNLSARSYADARH
jgi:hypothetical protein